MKYLEYKSDLICDKHQCSQQWSWTVSYMFFIYTCIPALAWLLTGILCLPVLKHAVKILTCKHYIVLTPLLTSFLVITEVYHTYQYQVHTLCISKLKQLQLYNFNFHFHQCSVRYQSAHIMYMGSSILLH